jgi:uncharacterized short protein YbdD (DUF466 family)
MFKAVKVFWQAIRQLSGDDAYERYLKHYTQHHSADGEPLSKKEFFKKWQNDKWRGVKRCC